MTKYICMADDCVFSTSDEKEAKKHKEMGEEHVMAEVSYDNPEEGVGCKTFQG